MMKKDRLMKAGLIILLGIFSMSGFAQKGVEDGSKYGHGEDSIRCIRNFSLYREYYKQKNYLDATPFWRVCYNECPTVSVNIYINGARIYSELIKKEMDQAKKSAYIDTLFMIYDQRVKYFGKKGKVYQRKGLDIIRFRGDDTEALKTAYETLKIAIDELKTKAMKSIYDRFVFTGIKLYNEGAINLDLLVNDYLMVSSILEERELTGIKKDIDEKIISVLDCETLVGIYTPKYEAEPDNLELLTSISEFFDKLDCTDEDLYFTVLTKLHSKKPTPSSSAKLAKLSSKKGDYKSALKYTEEAIAAEPDNKNKANLYLHAASLKNKLNDKVGARELAKKAIAANPNWGDPYLFIGNLYAKSEKDCNALSMPKAVYWVAIDKYVKAKQVDPSIAEKADAIIAQYKKYYPNKEESFMQGINAGDSYKVGCWINETTKARF